jgi:hypothetical protein
LPPRAGPDLAYDRVSWKGRSFTGEAFAGNSFSGKSWTGETHKGFTFFFDALWPAVQAQLKALVVNGDTATGVNSITFAGHSLGGAISPLLALAVRLSGARARSRAHEQRASLGSRGLGLRAAGLAIRAAAVVTRMRAAGTALAV